MSFTTASKLHNTQMDNSDDFINISENHFATGRRASIGAGLHFSRSSLTKVFFWPLTQTNYCWMDATSKSAAQADFCRSAYIKYEENLDVRQLVSDMLLKKTVEEILGKNVSVLEIAVWFPVDENVNLLFTSLLIHSVKLSLVCQQNITEFMLCYAMVV